jgi:hypothetical protein
MTINKIGRNTKPEYKRTISRTTTIQGQPGEYSGKANSKEKEALERLRNLAK